MHTGRAAPDANVALDGEGLGLGVGIAVAIGGWVKGGALLGAFDGIQADSASTRARTAAARA
jgi:hypothetical protein